MKLYRIRIRPERSPEVQRVFEFAARHSLLDVHDAIQTGFGLDDDRLHAFYLSGKPWDRTSEIASGDRPGELGRSSRVRLHELRLEHGQRFAYVYGVSDDHRYSLEVEALVDSDTPPDEPRLLESVGEATRGRAHAEEGVKPAPEISALVPLASDLVALFSDVEPSAVIDTTGEEALEGEGALDQRDGEQAPDDGDTLDGDEDDDEDSAFDDDDGALDDEDAFDDDDGALDDEDGDAPSAFDLEPRELDSAAALAQQLIAGLGGDGERFMALEQACDADLLSLLADLPAALAEAGKLDLGLELARQLAFLDGAHFLGERALLLANAGRREEALAELEAFLEAMASDSWAVVKGSDVYRTLGDSARAEALLRSALVRPLDDQTRDGALDRLLDLLTEQGRSAECRELLLAERQRLDATIRSHSETEQRLAPKVGRNDPCPCGSGKKHKKCCLT